MEYMNLGDLFNFLLRDYTVCNFDITGILGCYLNGLYILHNKLNIIHGDLTPMNILVTYMGSTYRQKIICDDKEYYINTNGYKYNISDFGLAEYIEEDDINNTYINHIYRDYLLLFFLYFNKTIFYNYNMFGSIIELCVEQIKDNLFESYGITDKYKKYFLENNNFTSVCNFMDQYLEIDYNDALFYDIPKILLKEFIELTVIDKK